MRRLAIIVALIAASTIVTPAHAEVPQHVCSGWRYDLTQESTRAVRGPRLVECVFSFLGLGGDIQTGKYVAERESHYYPWAYNPSGAAGIYQHLTRYWRGRALDYLPLWRFPNRATVSPFNATANVWVTARMVKAGGWGPWK